MCTVVSDFLTSRRSASRLKYGSGNSPQKPHAACAHRTKRPESLKQITELPKEGVP